MIDNYQSKINTDKTVYHEKLFDIEEELYAVDRQLKEIEYILKEMEK